MSTKTELTEQEFWALPEPDEGGYYELVNGQAVQKVSPQYFHSSLQAALLLLIRDRVQGKGRIRPEWSVRLELRGKRWIPCPDLTYISYERLPKTWKKNEPCPLPCDLAIEVISPDQTFKQLEEKAKDYFAAGVLRVWVVDPEFMSITVFFPNGTRSVYADDIKIIDALFPGLNLSVRQIFEEAELI